LLLEVRDLDGDFLEPCLLRVELLVQARVVRDRRYEQLDAFTSIAVSAVSARPS
jgi:hypothetical protein